MKKLNFLGNYKKVLVFAPHTDDAELGCGATIARLINEGTAVFAAAFSVALPCEKNINAKNNTMEEARAAAQSLGLKRKNLFFFDYEVRNFDKFRQNILDDMIRLRNEIKPDIVLLPSLGDFHQDHHVISREALRAFKHSSMLGYEEPWNNLETKTNLFVKVDDKHLQKKITAVECYKSQTARSFVGAEKIKSLAVIRGLQANAEFAEAFEIIRLFL